MTNSPLTQNALISRFSKIREEASELPDGTVQDTMIVLKMLLAAITPSPAKH